MASISALARPLLPPPPSWYPGHMSVFAKALPGLLTRTDIVLELRDARLPLTSINGTLEGVFYCIVSNFLAKHLVLGTRNFIASSRSIEFALV
jgi:hypothetical protein